TLKKPPLALWNAQLAATVATAASAWAVSRLLHRAAPHARLARAQQTLAVGLSALVVAVAVVQVFRELAFQEPEFLVPAWLAVLWLALGQFLFHTAPRWAISG